MPPLIDPQRDQLSKWKTFTGAGMCRGCMAYCCTFPVEVSIKDLHRLGLVSRDEMEGSPKKIARKLRAEGFISCYRANSGFFTLAQKGDESCIFLGTDRRCTVYDRRPEVCRIFPKIGPKPGCCPHRKIEN